MKWELDYWYELWDRAGSQGLDTWFDPRGVKEEGDLLPSAGADESAREDDGA